MASLPVLLRSAVAVALAAAAAPARAVPPQVQTVFIIAMENHNWTQPDGNVGRLPTIQQIKGNPNAPFINSLVKGTAVAQIGGAQFNISQQTAYTDNNHAVLYDPATGTAPSIHPSEPNYIWSEAGSNFGVLNDNRPFGWGGTNQNTIQHLSGLMQRQGVTWKSYQEDIDLRRDGSGQVVNEIAPRSQWTSPISNQSGTFGTGSSPNAYNGSQQYNYVVNHNPMVFFTDTNGGNDTTPANPATGHYAPLQQLATDLQTGAVARYNWITPDQFNDMHTALTGGYKGLTGESAMIRQGDDFLARVVPQIMASSAYKNNGAIVLWWDETEGTGAGEDRNGAGYTVPEIVISPLAHPNVNGLPYASPVLLTHSADLRTYQELFGIVSATPTGFLGDAANGPDLSSMFAAGAIPQGLPQAIP